MNVKWVSLLVESHTWDFLISSKIIGVHIVMLEGNHSMLLIIKLPFWCYWIQQSKSTLFVGTSTLLNQAFHFDGDEDSVCHYRFSMLQKAQWIVGK